MRKSHFIFFVIVAFLAGIAGAFLFPQKLNGDTKMPAAIAQTESTYDRVMRTGTIRCGYVVWTPFLLKDANSGKLSGLFYDYTEALGQALNLKIEWTEEMGWGDFPTALNSGRIDAMCGGSWPNSARAREIDFTRPIFYQPVYAYARVGDTRFDNNPDAINQPDITIVAAEGASPAVIANNDFPKAKKILMPELASLADVLVALATSKADVAIANPEAAQAYDTSNPGKIHRISAKMPLRVFGNCLAVGGGQDRFRRMLDIATGEMLASGQIEKMIATYAPAPGIWLAASPPYQIDTR